MLFPQELALEHGYGQPRNYLHTGMALVGIHLHIRNCNCGPDAANLVHQRMGMNAGIGLPLAFRPLFSLKTDIFQR